MKRYKDTDLIVNYHDAVIYGSDLELVEQPTKWLNDSIINFYFTYLMRRQQQQHKQKSATVPFSYYMMDPAVISFFMHQCTDDEDIDDFISSIPFLNKNNNQNEHNIIFIPVNDTMSLSSSNWQIPQSSSHWSLLVMNIINIYDTNDSVEYWHFDSIPNSGNINAAKDIAIKFHSHVFPTTRTTHSSATNNNSNNDNHVPTATKSSSFLTSSYPKIIQAKTPQQINGYDCGVHVISATKIFVSILLNEQNQLLCRKNNNSNDDDDDDPRNNNTLLSIFETQLQEVIGNDPSRFCINLRQEISSIIRQLKEER